MPQRDILSVLGRMPVHPYLTSVTTANGLRWSLRLLLNEPNLFAFHTFKLQTYCVCCVLVVIVSEMTALIAVRFPAPQFQPRRVLQIAKAGPF